MSRPFLELDGFEAGQLVGEVGQKPALVVNAEAGPFRHPLDASLFVPLLDHEPDDRLVEVDGPLGDGASPPVDGCHVGQEQRPVGQVGGGMAAEHLVEGVGGLGSEEAADQPLDLVGAERADLRGLEPG
jgi:hypothetical protein